jgi:hypothetical protein
MWTQGVMAATAAGLLFASQALAHGDHRGRAGRDIVYARVIDAVPIGSTRTIEHPGNRIALHMSFRPGRF